ncbi:MAG: hypothetical protein JST21_14520 [Bacteroidetes bacterium]|jgi:hypothetical protein|nr:hypothetical protein [Bacteroidota bacterium]
MSDLIQIKGFLLRENRFERTLVLRDGDFEHDLLNNDITKFIENEKIDSIEINENFCKTVTSLKFLQSIPFIVSIRVIKYGGVDYSDLKILSNLKKFINNYSLEAIDFSSFQSLEYLDIVWSKQRESFFKCSNLDSLTIHGYKGKDLQTFRNFKKLKSLSLISSSIQSLNGIESLTSLEEIKIYYNSKLHDLSSLSTCKNLKTIDLISLSKLESLNFLKNCNQLEILGIENCKNIKDNNAVFELINLRVLAYYNSGSFASITEIKNLKKLERFSIGTTDIIDGMLEPLLQLHKLAWCNFKNKKHYSLSLEDIQSKLNINYINSFTS